LSLGPRVMVLVVMLGSSEKLWPVVSGQWTVNATSKQAPWFRRT